MATLNNPKYALAQTWGNAGMLKALDSGDIAVPATNLAANDLIKVFRAPKGFIVTGAYLYATDLDTNGTPTLTLALGDLADDDRFVAASTIGQAGGTTITLASAGAGYVFAEDTDVYIKAKAASATAAAGTVRCALIGFGTIAS